LVVAAPLEAYPETGVGAVYVYRRGEAGFALSERIASPQPSQYGAFGFNVDLEGSVLLATSMDYPTSPFVHVYDVGDTNVSFIESIPLTHPEEDDYFIAVDLDMSGDHALVAVQSSSDIHPSYVVALERTDGHWSEVQVLSAEVPYPPNLQPFLQLVDVELTGDLAVIAWQDAAGTRIDLFQWTSPCEGCGAWVYASTVEGWTEDPSARTALDLHGSRLIVANSVTGMANVFDLDDRLGVPCSSTGTCAVGFCRDGVCCQDDCAGGDPTDCLACSVAAGGPIDGRCAPLDGAPCDDGNECTGIDTCVEGACVTGPLGPTTLCDDGDGCTAVDVCQSGACVGSGDPCDDENSCTVDACTNDGCEHVSVDDDTPCPGGSCFDGKCVPTTTDAGDEILDAGADPDAGEPDASGVTDAGTTPFDAGASLDAGADPTDAGPATPPACTCGTSSSGDATVLLAAFLAFTLCRRRGVR